MLSSSRVWVCRGGPPLSERVKTVSCPPVEPALAFSWGWAGASPWLAWRMYPRRGGVLIVIIAPCAWSDGHLLQFAWCRVLGEGPRGRLVAGLVGAMRG